MEQQDRQGGKRRCTHLRHMRGPSLSVYEFARRLTAGKEGRKFFASNATVADATGWSRETISTAKKSLVAEGWFKLLRSNREYGRDGKFRPSSYEILDHEAWAREHPGRCLTRSEGDTVENRHGQEGVDRHGSDRGDRERSDPALSLNRKSDSIPEGVSPPLTGRPPSLPSEEFSQKRKKKNGRANFAQDPRYQPIVDFYTREFKKLHGVNAPLDGGDGNGLKTLLRQQAEVSAETLVSWLANAFGSDDVPPLRPGFRLRAFCSHAVEYMRGPLLRSGSGTGRTETRRNDDPGKFAGLPVQ